MLHSKALGEQSLSYNWWTLLAKATIPWSNHWKKALTGRNIG